MVDRARRAAYDVLAAVRTDDAYANLALPTALAHHGLEGRDAALVTELVAGTLRRRGTYDAVLAACLSRPIERLDPEVLDCLRLGAHQLLATRVPAHAAISTSVDLARAVGRTSAAGLVNAVLRKVSAHDLDQWLEQVAPPDVGTPDARAAIVHSHPVWIVELLRRSLGERADELDALLAADNLAPAVTLVARPGRADRTELPGEPTRLSPYGVQLAGGEPGAVPAVAEARAGVQDEGSQLVAVALAAAELDDGPDALWVDLCAGPGGKAALLAALAAPRGAGLLALERAPHRSSLVAGNLRGAGGVLGVVSGDGLHPPVRPGSADRVLVDAPCTGLGALRRRPEARWRRTRADLTDLVTLQRALLASALDLVRPGGVVLYATCSPVLAETAGAVREALAGHDDVSLDDVAALLPQVADAAGPLPGTVQLWPHRHHTDAMFLALLRRDRRR